VLELPEGSLLDAAVVERATTFAKEHGLAPKEAQKALEFIDAEVAGAPERLREAFVEEAENHPVIGGANYEQTLRDASAGRAAMIEFGDWNDDTVAFLNNTGLGNHVAAIQLVARTGKLVQENRVLRQELQRLRHR
jgi:hypothetical protein